MPSLSDNWCNSVPNEVLVERKPTKNRTKIPYFNNTVSES